MILADSILETVGVRFLENSTYCRSEDLVSAVPWKAIHELVFPASVQYHVECNSGITAQTVILFNGCNF